MSDNEEGTVFVCVCGSFISQTLPVLLHAAAYCTAREHIGGNEGAVINFFFTLIICSVWGA